MLIKITTGCFEKISIVEKLRLMAWEEEGIINDTNCGPLGPTVHLHLEPLG
jgi:hypothetical protein